MKDAEKIKYHIRLLAEALDARENPIASLVISNDWSASDLDAAHDIFEKFDQRMERKEAVNWHSFEHEFNERFGFSYQSVKSVVLAFFRNDQWVLVCEAYATEHPCVEFSEIISKARRGFDGLLLERVAAIFARNNIPYVREKEIQMADGKIIRLDFVLDMPRAKVAVEVKGLSSQGSLEHVAQLASELNARGGVDEFWVIFEGETTGVPKLVGSKFLSVMGLDGLMQKLSIAS